MDRPPTREPPSDGDSIQIVNGQRAVPFRFYLVTDRKVCGERSLVDRLRVLAAGLPPGILAVQVREKDLEGRDLLALVLEVIEAVRPYGVPVFVNDRADVAMAAGADGVHLPGSGMKPPSLRAVWEGMIGASTHSSEEVAALAPGIVDFATFGPVFDTLSKRAYGPPQGTDALTVATASAAVPVFAIGGISNRTASRLQNTGISGLAAISAIWRAEDPVRTLSSLLRGAFGQAC